MVNGQTVEGKASPGALDVKAPADVEELLRALADPTRYRIVQLLLERNHCSRSLSMALGISEPAVSQHMTILKRCGLVGFWRHGHHVHYRVDEAAVRVLIDTMRSWLDQAKTIEDCHQGNPCVYRACCDTCHHRRQTIIEREVATARKGCPDEDSGSK